MKALLCALVSAILIQDTGAVQCVYVLKGKHVWLDIQKHTTDVPSFKWMFNFNNILKYGPPSSFSIFPKFVGKVEFNKSSLSLLLKDVQESENGSYLAKIDGEREVTVAEYVIVVQDKVTPAVLEVESTSSCNMTVTCRASNTSLSVTSTCYNSTCSQQGDQSSVVLPSTLSIYMTERFIICNHSNHVSWEKDTKEIEPHCQQSSTQLQNNIWIPVGVALPFLFLVFFLIIIFLQRKFADPKRKENLNTTYDSVQMQDKGQAGGSGSAGEPVDRHPAAVPGPGSIEASINFPSESPETVYAQVEKSNLRRKKTVHVDTGAPPEMLEPIIISHGNGYHTSRTK